MVRPCWMPFPPGLFFFECRFVSKNLVYFLHYILVKVLNYFLGLHVLDDLLGASGACDDGAHVRVL